MALHPNWNIAGDLGINESLDEARLPWGEFEPVRFVQMAEMGIKPDMGSEQIYFRILKYLEENYTNVKLFANGLCYSFMRPGLTSFV